MYSNNSALIAELSMSSLTHRTGPRLVGDDSGEAVHIKHNT